MKLTKSLQKLFFGIYISIHVLYSLVLLVPVLQSGSYWPIAITGFLFPFLLAVLIIFVIVNIIAKKLKQALITFIVLIAGWQQVTALIPFRFNSHLESEQQEGSIRILSWNVSHWDERNKEKKGGVSYRPLMMDAIQMQNADILCLQEFFECHDPAHFEANIPAIKKMGYPYHYFVPATELFEGKFQYGMCIFSKFPVVDTAYFENLKGEHSEGLCFADIAVNKKTIRVFNTHLESPGLNGADFNHNQQLKISQSVFAKLRNGYYVRNLQASFVAEQIRASPHPAILCSNTDDVPNSYAYFTLKGNLQDAFLQKGSLGLGKTYRFISPTLRIDHIFSDKKLKLMQFYSVNVPYSDHYPLVIEIKIQ